MSKRTSYTPEHEQCTSGTTPIDENTSVNNDATAACQLVTHNRDLRHNTVPSGCSDVTTDATTTTPVASSVLSTGNAGKNDYAALFLVKHQTVYMHICICMLRVVGCTHTYTYTGDIYIFIYKYMYIHR